MYLIDSCQPAIMTIPQRSDLWIIKITLNWPRHHGIQGCDGSFVLDNLREVYCYTGIYSHAQKYALYFWEEKLILLAQRYEMMLP